MIFFANRALSPYFIVHLNDCLAYLNIVEMLYSGMQFPFVNHSFILFEQLLNGCFDQIIDKQYVTDYSKTLGKIHFLYSC